MKNWIYILAVILMGPIHCQMTTAYGAVLTRDNTSQVGDNDGGTDKTFKVGPTGQIKWDSGTSKIQFSNNAGSSFDNFGADDQAGDLANLLENIGLDTSVASSALTVDLVQKDGATDATGSDEIRVSFRSATLTNGGYITRTVSAALTIVVPSTATLGHADATNEPIYVYLLDNAGTVELALSATQGFRESDRQTTTVLDTSSDAANVLYSAVARTDVGVRLIGRLISNQTTAGTWDASILEESAKTSSVLDDTVLSINTGGNLNLKTARLQSVTPSVSAQDGVWIDSVVDTGGVGRTTVNFTPGTFSVTPRCFCIAGTLNGGTCRTTVVSTTATNTTVEVGTTDTDGEHKLICVGGK